MAKSHKEIKAEYMAEYDKAGEELVRLRVDKGTYNGSRLHSLHGPLKVIVSRALFAGYLLGLAFLPIGVVALCGVGLVASIRRSTSSSRF